MIALKGSYQAETAIEAFKSITDIDILIKFNFNNSEEVDGYLTLKNETFPIEIKRNFRLNQLSDLTMHKKQYPNLILITDTLSENIKTALRENKINYLEESGNAFIQSPNAIILIDNQKYVSKSKNNKDKAFTNKGLVVVFHLLKDETLINTTYRYISEITGTSLDSITKTIQSLRQQGFIRQVDNKTMRLIEKKQLFEKWADAYEMRLKPKLLLGKFRFQDLNSELNWQKILLNNKSFWGGEPAADILTNFLKPANFTLYSTETRNELIKNYRFIPDKNGNIEIYQPFSLISEGQTVSPLLIYADLLNSGDSRNFEVAQKIKEQYVKNIF